MSKKKIEKEKKHTLRKYSSVIKAGIVLVILVILLVGVILFKPVKRDVVKDPNVFETIEKNVNQNDATCDGKKASDIRDDAARVNISYETVDDYFFGYMSETDEDINGNGIIDEEPVVENIGYALKLKMNNLTDNIYAIITNDLDEESKIFHSSDKDSNGQIIWFESDTIYARTYTVKIFSNNEKCTSELYREFNVTLPKMNPFIRSLDCEFGDAKDLDICKPFIFSTKSIKEDTAEFKRVLRELANQKEKNKNKENKEENNKEQTTLDKVLNYAKENYIIVAAVGAGIILLAVIFITTKKKGKK